MAKVIAVSISEQKGLPKRPIPRGEFIEGYGLKGDVHAGSPNRQVSLLGQESIDKVTSLGIQGLAPGRFAENITTQGIELFTLPIGTHFQINGAVFEITQIGKECHQKCAIFHQAGDCVMPKEGIFAKVIKSGIIESGNEIEII